jgi:hypothetical protein
VGLIDKPMISQVTPAIAKCIQRRTKQRNGPETTLHTCGGVGVAHKGYAVIYKTSKNGIGLVEECNWARSIEAVTRPSINTTLAAIVANIPKVCNAMEVSLSSLPGTNDVYSIFSFHQQSVLPPLHS